MHRDIVICNFGNNRFRCNFSLSNNKFLKKVVLRLRLIWDKLMENLLCERIIPELVSNIDGGRLFSFVIGGYTNFVEQFEGTHDIGNIIIYCLRDFF